MDWLLLIQHLLLLLYCSLMYECGFFTCKTKISVLTSMMTMIYWALWFDSRGLWRHVACWNDPLSYSYEYFSSKINYPEYVQDSVFIVATSLHLATWYLTWNINWLVFSFQVWFPTHSEPNHKLLSMEWCSFLRTRFAASHWLFFPIMLLEILWASVEYSIVAWGQS